MTIGQGSSKNNVHVKGQACCVHYHQPLQQLNDPLQSSSNNYELKQKAWEGLELSMYSQCCSST